MKSKERVVLIILLSVSCFIPMVAYANSAEPPTLIVIMKNAPEDVSVSAISAGRITEGEKIERAWETYYVFYNEDIMDDKEITLRVCGNGTSYDQVIEQQYLTGYNNIVTLDFSKRTITEGKLLSRSIVLVTLRVSLTLVIEGIIFFLFGFRDKNSWIAFLIINLLTQGALNIVINSVAPIAGYMILSLLFIEFFVFIAEIIGVLAFIKEYGILRRVSFVVVANLASLVLGGYLITVLPI
ncbi:hypothetical protein [Mahella australiensis]|uniref:Uncharacterized protein n=1 Tax=Mahella australiensis (strain DSM 15567 / CIP 107919 / 50-1 BON) TaxID=697281 RepID=F3ZY76_MAHA5|nr:hypothetical protein [Mahella australiensis]AEE95601.1 hypothetical protein Mahau_0385 [Mahella australiensis 50-1 BON]